jgi:radical SAM superfamily enzyme YgiQ (UPF0313 family)
LVVDDNLIGTRTGHIARAKDLFRAMAKANLQKEWVGQATINFADDEELMALASKAGCRGVFIGFESPSPEGLLELGKKFNLLKGRDIRASVRRIQRHNIMIVGSFIIGLDVDQSGIGERIADMASHYGLDNLNALFLTPLPGTRLWDQMKADGRLPLNVFPEDWKYYTLTSCDNVEICLLTLPSRRCSHAGSIPPAHPAESCAATYGSPRHDQPARRLRSNIRWTADIRGLQRRRKPSGPAASNQGSRV